MNGTKKRIFPVHYAPGKKLFHIVVTLSDAPGSYSSILDMLRTKVNLIGTSTYSHSDGTAVFSGFAEGISPDLTTADLEKQIKESKAAMKAEVHEGQDGLLVDMYHTGFVVDNDEYVLIRREGLVQVLERVSKMLGSGGDLLLFEEGMALGLKDAETMVKNMGKERVRAHKGILNRFLAAEGWGVIEMRDGASEKGFTVSVSDCFECSKPKSSRKGCNFVRGYLVGDARETFGKDYDAEETKCVLRGDKSCEFRLTPRD